MTARAAPLTRARPRLRVVAGRRVDSPRVAPWVLFTAAAVVAFFALILSRTMLDHAAFELHELETSIAQQQGRYHQLRIEVARLQSPRRVAPLAAELGMVFPTQSEPITVEGVIDGETQWAETRTILTAPSP